MDAHECDKCGKLYRSDENDGENMKIYTGRYAIVRAEFDLASGGSLDLCAACQIVPVEALLSALRKKALKPKRKKKC